MAAASDPVEQAAEELYALPPGEFTRARDERAKVLRKSGDREAADALKRLRKPTVAAWALNQLPRKRPKDLERLLAAGDELRAAQEELLAGGERSTFQKAAAQERELVARLTGEALELASESGERPSAGLEEKISGTLHAAALDEETAEQLRTGRLTREREAIGGFGDLATAAPSAPARAGRGASGAPAKRKPAASRPSTKTAADTGNGASGDTAGPAPTRDKTAGDTRARAAERARQKAAAEDAQRRQRLAGARTDERHARRELEAAAKTLQHAATRAEAAEAHAEDAVKRAKTARERLTEARREETAAKKAHTRAEKALRAAEADT